MSKQIPWPRVFAEGVVIVFSILLAFVIDAWWDELQLADDVGQDLDNVAQELEGNLALLLFQLDLTERMVAGGAVMAETMELESTSDALSLPDTLVWLGTSTGPTLNASLGALDALIASGRLAAVDNPLVRLKLGGLPSQIDDIVENQVRVVALSETQIRPLSYDRVDNTLDLAVADSVYNGDLTVDRRLLHQSTVTYPNSLSLRNLVRVRRTILATAIPKMTSVRADLEELLEILR